MISRLIQTSSLAVLNVFRASYLFCSAPTSNFRSNNTYGSGKFDQYRSLNDLLKFVKEQELSESDLQEICKIIKNKEKQVNQNVNFNQLTIKLQALNIEAARVETIDALCNIACYLSEVKKSARGDLLERITKKISEADLNTVSIYNLISFLNFSIETNNYELTKKITAVYTEKLPFTRLAHNLKFLGTVVTSRDTDRDLKILINSVVSSIENDFDSINLSGLVKLYIYLNSFNRRVVEHRWDFMNKLESKLEQNIEEIDEKDMVQLLSFHHPDNKLIRLIINKIFESIDEEGETQIPISSLRNIMLRINSSIRWKYISAQKEEKLLKVVLKNLDNHSFVLHLIQSQFIGYEGLKKIHQKVVAEKIPPYLQSVPYLYECSLRGIVTLADIPEILEKIKSEVGLTEKNKNVRFMQLAVMVDNLTKNQKENKQIKELRQLFEEQVAKWSDLPKFPYFRLTADTQPVEDFNRRFGNVFVGSWMDKHPNAEENSSIDNNLLTYLVASNDIRRLQKILRQKQLSEAVGRSAKNLLRKVVVSPAEFYNSLGTINYILNNLDKQVLGSNIRYIREYLSDWRVQNALKTIEIKSYIKLYQRLIVHYEQPQKIQDTLFYLINSPVKELTSSKAYCGFLLELQKKIVGISTDKDIYKVKSLMLTVAKEASLLNSMSRAFAKLLVQTNVLKESSFVSSYAKIEAGNLTEIEEIQVKDSNIVLLFKTGRIPAEYYNSNKGQIEDCISKASANLLMTCLINFQNRGSRAEKSFEVVNFALNKLREKIEYIRDYDRLELVISHLEQINLSSKAYSEFIRALIGSIERKLNTINISVINSLVQAAMAFKIDCKQFVDKYINNFVNRLRKGEINKMQVLDAFEFFVFSESKKAFQVFIEVLKDSKIEELNAYLNRILILIDHLKPEYVRALSNQIEKNKTKKFEIDEAVWKYVTQKNPDFNSLSEAISLVPNKLPHEFIESMANLLSGKSIEHQVHEVLSHRVLQVEDKYIYFTESVYNPLSHERVKDFVLSTFSISEKVTANEEGRQESNFIICYVNKKRLSNTCRFLSKVVEQLKDSEDDIYKCLAKKSPQAEPQGVNQQKKQ